MLYADEFVINDGNYSVMALPQDDSLGQRARGMVPRDWLKYPLGFYPGEVGMKAVPELGPFDPSTFPQRIKDLEDSGSRLSDYRMKGGPGGGMIPSRDQNGMGYCWKHSGTSAQLLVRARDGMPYVDLSAYAGACMIKNFRDEGGWGAQGLQWSMDKGDPSGEFWPQQSVSRANDNPATWANAKLHRFTEGWIDMGSPEYSRTLTFNQTITSLLCLVPVIVDFNWWSHSVCAADAVNGVAQWGVTRSGSGKLMEVKEFDAFWGVNNPITGGISIRIWNSWGDGWSSQGMGVLTGQKAIPDGATAPRVATWSAV
jgi:hypothetical protein